MIVRHLGLDELLVIASSILGTRAEVLALRCDLNSAESALNAPTAEADGIELYPSIAEKGAVLFGSLARAGVFPRDNTLIAFTALDLFLTTNGWRWRFPPMHGDARRLSQRLLQGVAANTVSEAHLIRWLNGAVAADSRLESQVQRDPTTYPQIFISFPITTLSPEMRTMIRQVYPVIQRSLNETASVLSDTWLIRPYGPITWIEGQDFRSTNVYDRTSRQLMNETAALVIIQAGGSMGCGELFAWACQARIPILWVRHAEQPPSPLLAGASADVTEATFTTSQELRDAVARWLITNHRRIDDHERRKRNHELRITPLFVALRSAYKMATPVERFRACQMENLTARRMVALLNDIGQLRNAPLAEIDAFARGLRVDIGRYLQGDWRRSPTPAVAPMLATPRRMVWKERVALNVAAHEYNWSRTHKRQLRAIAKREMAQSIAQQLPLDTPLGWVSLHRRSFGR